ncbi:MAG: NAD(P)-binding domain-containing protein [Chitinophagales bacterium]|nr:NAD(P)-binding domain-containing protein [Chitinophagales bacterium]
MDTKEKYCIIGAGPAGLAGAKNLIENNIPFDGYDAGKDVGGLWNINNPLSTMYESAHLISSKTMTEFKDFPMKNEVADYPSHTEMFNYFRDYAEHFGIKKHYTFETSVVKTEEKDGLWEITLDNGEKKLYKGLIIANGTLAHPNIPKFKGNFTGEIFHSKDYKNSDVFAGKKVLIIGAGNSGCDIAVDAIHRAKRTAISMRRGYHFVPKYVFGKPADTLGGLVNLPTSIKRVIDKRLLKLFTGDPQRVGFPEPDHKLYEAHPIVNSLIVYYAGHGDIDIKGDIDHFEGKTVYFKNGTQEDYDLILLATGYKLHYPFIDNEELNWKGASPHLYLNIFHPEKNNLFVLGMVEASGLGWEGRNEQAKLVAKFIKENEAGSNKAKAFVKKKQEPFERITGDVDYIKLDRMAYYVHKDTYRKKVVSEIKGLS